MAEQDRYWFLSRGDRAKVEALDGHIHELRERLKASFSEEQKRLDRDLDEAESDRDYEVHFAQMQGMAEHLAEHFPGIGLALKLVAGHCAWGSDIGMGCCELHDHGVGL
jgi:hypothetical protein